MPTNLHAVPARHAAQPCQPRQNRMQYRKEQQCFRLGAIELFKPTLNQPITRRERFISEFPCRPPGFWASPWRSSSCQTGFSRRPRRRFLFFVYRISTPASIEAGQLQTDLQLPGFVSSASVPPDLIYFIASAAGSGKPPAAICAGTAYSTTYPLTPTEARAALSAAAALSLAACSLAA